MDFLFIGVAVASLTYASLEAAYSFMYEPDFVGIKDAALLAAAWALCVVIAIGFAQ